MESNLREKTAKGVGWGFIESFAGTGIIALVNIVLARLLSPADFGIIGMTTIFITLSTSLVDSGFTGALTRKKSVSKDDLNSVFYFNLLISTLLYFILFFSAPAIAGFFREPLLVPVIRFLSLSLFVTALSIVQKITLVRKLDFKTQALASTISSLISGIISIILAVKGYGLWSLVALQLSRLTFQTVALWIFSGWIPSLSFSWRSFRESFSFGSKLLLTSVISVIWTEIYSIIIGKIYNSSTLGQYNRAEKFKNLVTSNVSIVMQKVSYPVLSSIMDQSERQTRAYRKVVKTTVLISFTAVMGLAAVSEAFILTLVGDQWIPAIGYLRILAFSGLFIPLQICSANIINANGRSDLTLRLEIIKTVLAVIPVMAGIWISVEALLYAITGVSVIVYLFHAYYVTKVLSYSVKEQFRDILPTLAISLLMAAIVFALSYLPLPQWLILLIQISAGVSIIIFIYEKIYASEEYLDIKRMFLKSLGKVR